MTKQNPLAKSSVAGVIFNQKRDAVLLIKRRDVNIWVIPGGGVDPGETPEEAIVREFFEETGLSVSVVRQVGLYTPINRLSNHSHLFECSIVNGDLSRGSETREIGFFSLVSLPSPLFFLHQEWIKDAKIPTHKMIRRPLTEITYFNLIKYFICHPVQVSRILLSRCGIPMNS